MSAAGRLWRRSPLWRGALLLGLPASALAGLFPPDYVHSRPPEPPVARVFEPTPSATAPERPQATPARIAAPDRTVAMAMRARLMPFYRLPVAFDGPRADGWPSEATIEASEATTRPVFSVSAPYVHREIVLPPGDWTSVAVSREYQTDDGPPGLTEAFARIERQVVTGMVLLRGSDPNQPSDVALPTNPNCGPGPRTLRVEPLPAPSGGEACWFAAWPVPPNLVWPLADAPPALRIATHTLAANGDRLPTWLSGFTYFRSDVHQWIEVTYLFDPERNGAVPVGEDGKPDPDGALKGRVMAEFLVHAEAWLRKLLPLLEHLGSTPLAAASVAPFNRDTPR